MTFDRKQYHREYYKKNQNKLKKDQKTRYYKKDQQKPTKFNS